MMNVVLLASAAAVALLAVIFFQSTTTVPPPHHPSPSSTTFTCNTTWTTTTNNVVTDYVKFRRIDLNLPESKTPAPFSNRQTTSFMDAVGSLWSPDSDSPHKHKPNVEDDEYEFGILRDRNTPPPPPPPPPRDLTAAVGSKKDNNIIVSGDSGLFGTVFEAWSNHWDLRTSPEDWWTALMSRVSSRIDDMAHNPDVASLFVPGQSEKKTIKVTVVAPDGIYTEIYESIFNSFAEGIQENIAVPGYCEAATADFSTTTPVRRLGSQIAIMKSTSKYFDYEIGMCGCGLHALEMTGDAEDWERLGTKLASLRALLSPAERVLNLSSFFERAAGVFSNLHRTFLGDDRTAAELQDWWADVLIQGEMYKYGPSGIGGTKVEAYNGWLVEFMLMREGAQMEASEFASGRFAKELTCLSSVDIKIKYSGVAGWPNDPEDMSVVAAGLMGYRVFPATEERRITLEPAHGWSLMLPEDSPLRRL